MKKLNPSMILELLENMIIKLNFDIEVSPTCLANESSSSKLLANIEKDIKEKAPEYRCVITVDLAL